jgi:hypothetical protein
VLVGFIVFGFVVSAIGTLAGIDNQTPYGGLILGGALFALTVLWTFAAGHLLSRPKTVRVAKIKAPKAPKKGKGKAPLTTITEDDLDTTI